MDVDLKRVGGKMPRQFVRDRRMALADWACPDLIR